MRPVPKAAFPYLVDIGVTTVCGKGCSYCYAKAGPGGKHADINNLIQVLPDVLMKANVFEVVLGGYGEPTLYMNHDLGIDYVAKAFKSRDFKVGLTTNNHEWNEASRFHDAIQQLDSVAVSCNSPDDLMPAIRLAKAIREEPVEPGSGCIHGPVVSIQTIAGIMPWGDTLGMIQEMAGDPHWIRNITILGFKEMGRARHVAPYTLPKGWIGQVKALEDITIGIDATMVSSWGDELLASGVEDYRLAGAEGRQTCFVDAVGMTVKASSFSKLSYPFDGNEFLKTFAIL